MNERDLFEKDYLAAFELDENESPLYWEDSCGAYIDEAHELAFEVWQQQAARHKAEIAELVEVLEIGLDCAIAALNAEQGAGPGLYRFSAVEAAKRDVDAIRAAIAKYEKEQS